MTRSARKSGLLAAFLCTTSLFAAGPTAAMPVSGRADTAAQLAVTASGNARVDIEFTLPAAVAVVTEGRLGEVAGTERSAVAGEPDLPCRTFLVGIPPTGGVRLSFTTGGTGRHDGVEVRPVPSFDEREQPRSPVFEQDRLWPGAPVELLGIETFRGIRAARVRVNPVQYQPVQGYALVHREVRLTLTFDRPAEANPRPDPLDPLVRGLLVNGEQARDWRIDSVPADTVNFFGRYGPWCRVRTDTTGVYRVTPADLTAAGFDAGVIDPTTLRLFAMGRHAPNGPYPDTMVEVPLYVTGDGDGRFDGRDYAAFYAESPSYWDDSLVRWQPNLFTNHGCYWLTWGAGPGRRMATVSGAGAAGPKTTALRRVRLEADSLCPARSGLLWLWQNYVKVAGPFTDTFHRTLNLPARETLVGLRGRVYGRSPDNRGATYRVVLRLNGALLDTLTIPARASGPSPVDFRFDELPSASAARGAGTDTLSFELIDDRQVDVLLDYLEADYVARLEVTTAAPWLDFHYGVADGAEFSVAGAASGALLLDVSDPWQPRRITDFGVAGNRAQFRLPGSGLTRVAVALESRLRQPQLERRTPGALRTPLERADYYLVSPDEFMPAARLYAAFRDGNVPGIPGARARAVRLGDIYDDYAFGWEEPGAIKKFFSYKRPGYGLLAGDATYDYRNNLRLGDRTPYVPAYELGYDIDPEVYGLIARGLDAWYADFEGSGASPDMVLGRVTCRSAVELRQFMDKVRRYESQPLGLWARRLLLLGDDEYLGEPGAPESFEHIQNCEALLSYADTTLDIVKVYLTEYPLVQIKDKAGARAELKRQLDAGALCWFYFGHGAGFRLAHEQALNVEDIPMYHNGGRMPLAFYGSCGVGRFEDTRYQAIAEEFVRKADGCIATMGATKATTGHSNLAFARLMFTYLLAHPDLPAGAAFYQSWAQVNNLYHFFGDPAFRLRLPQAGSRPATNPGTFFPGGHVAVTESAPAPVGYWEMVAQESEFDRYYASDVGSINYQLNGARIWAGGGRFDGGQARSAFTVPLTAYPETITVPNGRCTRIPNSCRVSALVWTDAGAFSATNCRIPFRSDTASVSGDAQPPTLDLYADRTRLRPGETTAVPLRFTLEGRVSDPSGILLFTPQREYGIEQYRFDFYVGDPNKDSSLAESFEYDENSTTSGRFRRPLEIRDSVTVIGITVSDNCLNRLATVCGIRTDLGERLGLDSCLVYPNPTPGPALFTFNLTRSAQVSVKIYTISGRLVRFLPPRTCRFGYNQIEWDGNDRDGMRLANGIYLYKLDASSSETMGGSSRTAHRDKFIIKR